MGFAARWQKKRGAFGGNSSDKPSTTKTSSCPNKPSTTKSSLNSDSLNVGSALTADDVHKALDESERRVLHEHSLRVRGGGDVGGHRRVASPKSSTRAFQMDPKEGDYVRFKHKRVEITGTVIKRSGTHIRVQPKDGGATLWK